MKTIDERKILFENRGQIVVKKKGLLWITLFNQKSLVCFILDICYANNKLIGKTHIERMIGYPLEKIMGRTVAWQTDEGPFIDPILQEREWDGGRVLFLEEQGWFKKAFIKL